VKHRGRVKNVDRPADRHTPGKIIGITGTAELYKGKPEINVVDEAIKGADSQSVAG
jgi:DNA/RNA endonuclease YhcR with UshA esterase domain